MSVRERCFGLGLAAVSFVVLLGITGEALACACCSNPGQRHVGVSKIDSYTAGVLQEFRFAENAQLYVGEAGIEDIKGIMAKSEAWMLTLLQTNQVWRFAFDDRKGNVGVLSFALPSVVTKFEVDPRDTNRAPPPDEPLLYKEWRLTTKATGGGMLAGSTGGSQQATLILHGRGNSCTDASQFTAWTLVLHGPQATNTIFGSLRTRS